MQSYPTTSNAYAKIINICNNFQRNIVTSEASVCEVSSSNSYSSKQLQRSCAETSFWLKKTTWHKLQCHTHMHALHWHLHLSLTALTSPADCCVLDSPYITGFHWHFPLKDQIQHTKNKN